MLPSNKKGSQSKKQGQAQANGNKYGVYDSPMVPIQEDDEQHKVPEFSIHDCLKPIEVERKNTQIEISSFDVACKKLVKSPGMISEFSTSKATAANKYKNSKYEDDSDDDMDSSDDCLSYEEGVSINAYSDVIQSNHSKQSLANLRRKTVYLTQAPMKPLHHENACYYEDESSDEDDVEDLLNIRKKRVRRNTVQVNAFKV